MLCVRCEALLTASTGPSANRTEGLSPVFQEAWTRLNTLLCARCGVALSFVDPANSTLERMSQLARFGLAAGARPILARSRAHLSRVG